MNISSQISRNQSGIALIIFLTVIVLGAATFLVSKANDSRFQTAINAQKQTNTALRQAKEALLGFAAVYAKTHTSQPQGYLPCPDINGDGSSDILGTICGTQGESMLGRFPWRTLGLPPLRDGNGDCLWYAVSGNYKDKEKSALTSDTPGLFVVENVNGDKIAGGTCALPTCTSKETESNEVKQAIAIIFSPGKILNGQSRTVTANNANICGSTDSSDNINQANNYLDSFKISAGYDINNSNGTKSTLPTKKNSVFVKIPLAYQIDDEGKTNTGEILFNDTLMLVTRKDFEPIYERMDLWVAKKASLCLEQSVGSKYQKNFLNTFNGATENYRAEPKNIIKIQEYIDDNVKNCKAECDDTQKTCLDEAKTCTDINTECKSDIYIKDKITGCTSIEAKDEHRKESIFVEERFPWVAYINDDTCFNVSRYKNEDDNTTDYKLACKPTDKRFGRIPNVPDNTNNGMLQEWTNKCFMNYWWDEWKDKVFYAVDDSYTADNTTHFWIKSVQRTWNGETWPDFKDRRDGNIEKTFARIQGSDTKKWELVAIPTIPANDILKLNDTDVNKFTILVSGRRINTQTRADDSDKMDIDNYLEGNNYSNFKNYLEDDTCPICDFERKRTDENFNDVVCKDKNDDCKIPK